MVVIAGTFTIYDRPTVELVCVIADVGSLGIPVPEEAGDDVDVLVILDKDMSAGFRERRFYGLRDQSGMLSFKGFHSESEFDQVRSEVVGEVMVVKVPWVEGMGGKATGFSEESELF